MVEVWKKIKKPGEMQLSAAHLPFTSEQFTIIEISKPLIRLISIFLVNNYWSKKKIFHVQGCPISSVETIYIMKS